MNPDLLFRYLMGSFGAVCAAIFFLKAYQAWLVERSERKARRYDCIRDHECDRRFQSQPMQPDRRRRMRGSARLGLLMVFTCAAGSWAAMAYEMHRLHAVDWMWQSMGAIALFWLISAAVQLLGKRRRHVR